MSKFSYMGDYILYQNALLSITINIFHLFLGICVSIRTLAFVSLTMHMKANIHIHMKVFMLHHRLKNVTSSVVWKTINYIFLVKMICRNILIILAMHTYDFSHVRLHSVVINNKTSGIIPDVLLFNLNRTLQIRKMQRPLCDQSSIIGD